VATGTTDQVRGGKALQRRSSTWSARGPATRRDCHGWAPHPAEAAPAAQRAALVHGCQGLLHHQYDPCLRARGRRLRGPGPAARPERVGGFDHGHLHRVRVRLADPADLCVRPGQHPRSGHAGALPAAHRPARCGTAGRLGQRRLAGGQRARLARGDGRAGSRRARRPRRGGRGAAGPVRPARGRGRAVLDLSAPRARVADLLGPHRGDHGRRIDQFHPGPGQAPRLAADERGLRRRLRRVSTPTRSA
jgi:hypothetical protein